MFVLISDNNGQGLTTKRAEHLREHLTTLLHVEGEDVLVSVIDSDVQDDGTGQLVIYTGLDENGQPMNPEED